MNVKESIKKGGMFYAEFAGFNEDFEEMGHICPFEYCIETQPLPEERSSASCPVFGHDCPAGRIQAEQCED